MTSENSSLFFHEKSGQHIPCFIYPSEWPEYFETPTSRELEDMIAHLLCSDHSSIFPLEPGKHRLRKRMINVQAFLNILDIDY